MSENLSIVAESNRVRSLETAPWKCCAVRPDTISQPGDLDDAAVEWLTAAVPGTAAAALAAAGRWAFDHPTDIDAHDWWWCTSFARPESRGPCELVLEGLATLAEVWLNHRCVLTTDNMFREYRVDLSAELADENTLAIVFRSLTTALQTKRPRPRWKTNLVDHQQRRWFRSTLLGHIPGWSPPVPTVGPWRAIRMESSAATLVAPHIVTSLNDGNGIVTFRSLVRTAATISQAVLRVGEIAARLFVAPGDDETTFVLTGELSNPHPQLWWPHTHGSPFLYDAEIELIVDGEVHRYPLSPIGFRQLEIGDQPDGFSVTVNGEPIYCRGACWTVGDILTLDATEASLRHDLELARDAGVNLLRVGGTMIYESEAFFRLCDQLGILVWQDFMFASMDYPVDDPAFLANITAEATQLVRRTASHPCVMAYCGGSEIEQQAAMLGLPPEFWTNRWFAELLPALCREGNPTATYVRNSPTGGVLPFDPAHGVSHYYGIGAYRRSLSELRQANVRFTTECLGFSNLPDPAVVNEIMDGGRLATHDPRWKRRVPRDTGAGWDFEDIRDHYLCELYGVDAVSLRAVDPMRYQQLSRTVPGEMMARVFGEWRSGASSNRGGLVWFYKDLWPAAGWGVIDSAGQPKSTYYYLKRAWQPRQITLTDEGLSGLCLHLINETPIEAAGFVEVTLLKQPRQIIAQAERPITLPARSTQSLNVTELLGRFYDVNHAYRFGPAPHDVVVATLRDDNRNIIGESFYLLRRENPRPVGGHTLSTHLELLDPQTWGLTLESDTFLHTVRLSAKGFTPDDNDFHLSPARSKTIRFRSPTGTLRAIKIDIEALNLDGVTTVVGDLTQSSTKVS